MISKPFLLAVCRLPGAIADDELKQIMDWGELSDTQLETLHLAEEDITDVSSIDLNAYSGLIITGSPFGFTHDDSSAAAKLVKERILILAQRALAQDFPTLGICFGLQAITLALGGSLISGFGEDLQAPRITLTEEGKNDPLVAESSEIFYAYTGHSDAIGEIPGDGVLLASGDFCAVQMVRWGNNVYGTQFHPEIMREGMHIRINSYGDTYYPAHEKAAVISRCDAAEVEEANKILTRFTQRYGS